MIMKIEKIPHALQKRASESTLINDINDRLKGIGIDDQPFSCFVNSEVESFNAEVYGQPTVVRDEQGDVTVGVTGDLPSITMPCKSILELNY